MLRRVVAVAAALLLFLSVALPASASTHSIGTGTIAAVYSTGRWTYVRETDVYRFAKATVQGNYTGTITGQYVETNTGITHRNGITTVNGVDTCSSCAVDGHTGALIARFQGVVVNGFGQGSWGVNGSGGLAGFHAEGSWSGTIGMPLDYTIRYHFDPK